VPRCASDIRRRRRARRRHPARATDEGNCPTTSNHVLGGAPSVRMNITQAGICCACRALTLVTGRARTTSPFRNPVGTVADAVSRLDLPRAGSGAFENMNSELFDAAIRCVRGVTAIRRGCVHLRFAHPKSSPWPPLELRGPTGGALAPPHGHPVLQEIASPGIVAGRAKRRSDDTTTPATREPNAARAKPRPWRDKVRLKKCKGDSQYARRKRADAKGGEVRLKKCDSKRATQKCAVAASTNEIENALATRFVSAATT
jgi:hypothetical protein